MMCRSVAVIILAGLGAGCAQGGEPPSSTPTPPGAGAWTAKAALPTARQEMPSALIAGRIYTPGGYDAAAQTTAVLEIYEVATDRWSTGPSMPEGRNHPGVVAVAGSVFVVGGYSATATSAGVFAFDPVAQRWSTRRAMPAPRAAHASVELAG